MVLTETKDLTNGVFITWEDLEVIKSFKKERERLLLTSTSFKKALKEAIALNNQTFEHDGTVWEV
jgi:hypothetical protein